MAKILVVEDNPEVVDNVRSYLKLERHTVDCAADGHEASYLLRHGQYDLVILDWILPGKSGPELCQEFRSRGGSAPILMLTARDTVSDKEQGLDAGADDYLTKPFNLRELAARVRALLRRPQEFSGGTLQAGGLVLDPVKYKATLDGQPVSLVPREFALLEFFLRHPNQVFSADALLERVWPADSDASTEALRSTLKRLRAKVDPEGKILRTIHGVGYILELP